MRWCRLTEQKYVGNGCVRGSWVSFFMARCCGLMWHRCLLCLAVDVDMLLTGVPPLLTVQTCRSVYDMGRAYMSQASVLRVVLPTYMMRVYGRTNACFLPGRASMAYPLLLSDPRLKGDVFAEHGPIHEQRTALDAMHRAAGGRPGPRLHHEAL